MIISFISYLNTKNKMMIEVKNNNALNISYVICLWANIILVYLFWPIVIITFIVQGLNNTEKNALIIPIIDDIDSESDDSDSDYVDDEDEDEDDSDDDDDVVDEEYMDVNEIKNMLNEALYNVKNASNILEKVLLNYK